MNDLISVIIPVYNTEKYLNICLDSIINQTYKNIEIIIVNDCSTDNSESVILEYMEKDSRIKYYKNSKNHGAGYTRNIGISKASGKYIYFPDSDDEVEKDALEKLHNAISDENSFSCMLKMATLKTDGTKGILKRSIEDCEILQSPSVCMRLFNKRILDESQIRFSNLYIAEDLEFVFKILIYNNNVSYVDDCLYTYIRHETSTTKGNISHDSDVLKALDNIEIYAKVMGKYNILKEKIEACAVSHILLGAIVRVSNKLGKTEENLKVYIDYINKKYPYWSYNDYVIKRYLSKKEYLKQLKSLKNMGLKF